MDFTLLLFFPQQVHTYPGTRFSKQDSLPQIKDPHLKVEIIANGLKLPTSIAFLGPDDILVLEKDNGSRKKDREWQDAIAAIA